MITKIGLVAGDIWDYLERQGREARLNKIVEELDKDHGMVLMSIGWLAREGHVMLEGEGPDYLVKLT